MNLGEQGGCSQTMNDQEEKIEGVLVFEERTPTVEEVVIVTNRKLKEGKEG